jgi:DNA-3-methyladenine glycosylase
VGRDNGVNWLTAPAADVASSARSLLGWQLRAGPVAVVLTEVEAYAGVGGDPASHAHRGRTPRTAVMFGPAGVAYVYFVFGMHWCINVVCGQPGEASAVLLRAGEVVDGIDVARSRRPGVSQDRELARGPGRLALALGIDGLATGTSLIDGTGPMTLTAPARTVPAARVRSGPRVGVAGGADLPWRFWLDGEPSVSVYRKHVPRRRVLEG